MVLPEFEAELGAFRFLPTSFLPFIWEAVIFLTTLASFFAAFGLGATFLEAVFLAALVSLLLLAVLAFVVEDLFTEAAFDFAGFGLAVLARLTTAFLAGLAEDLALLFLEEAFEEGLA